MGQIINFQAAAAARKLAAMPVPAQELVKAITTAVQEVVGQAAPAVTYQDLKASYEDLMAAFAADEALLAAVAADKAQAAKRAENLAYQGPEAITGSKYEATQGMDIAEVAKLVRADIKAAIKAGELPAGKYSVRIDRFSMGQSLDVRISGLADNPWSPEWIEGTTGDDGKFDNIRAAQWPARSRYTTEATATLAKAKAILAAYNRDASDTMTDYFNVRFYGDASFDWQWADQAEAALRSQVQR